LPHALEFRVQDCAAVLVTSATGPMNHSNPVLLRPEQQRSAAIAIDFCTGNRSKVADNTRSHSPP
jgi:hypothetical protein